MIYYCSYYTYDKDGNIIETIDMLAYQAQQALLTESRQALSASKTMDGGPQSG
jgi:hypothetical protein